MMQVDDNNNNVNDDDQNKDTKNKESELELDTTRHHIAYHGFNTCIKGNSTGEVNSQVSSGIVRNLYNDIRLWRGKQFHGYDAGRTAG